jgi:cellobiose transport system substrate-binding protein
MSNAPTGQIFAATAENLKPQYLGKKNGPTRVEVENVITRVQQGSLKANAAWPEAIKAAQKAATS